MLTLDTKWNWLSIVGESGFGRHWSCMLQIPWWPHWFKIANVNAQGPLALRWMGIIVGVGVVLAKTRQRPRRCNVAINQTPPAVAACTYSDFLCLNWPQQSWWLVCSHVGWVFRRLYTKDRQLFSEFQSNKLVTMYIFSYCYLARSYRTTWLSSRT